MPRYTPIIFARGRETPSHDGLLKAFSDQRRFNEPITLAGESFEGRGSVRRFDRELDPAFLACYAAQAADRMYPYDPIVMVDSSVQEFDLSIAVLGIDLAVHAVMKGHPVMLAPTPLTENARMTIGRVTFPAPEREKGSGVVVLARTDTVVDLISSRDTLPYLTHASMSLRISGCGPLVPVSDMVADARGRTLACLFNSWIGRNEYAVGSLTSTRRSSTS